MVQKKNADNQRPSDISEDEASVELVRQEMGGVEVDRWHADNVDDLLFAPQDQGIRRLYNDDELREIESFDDYLARAQDDELNADDFLGSGAEVLMRKELMRLVGIPLRVIQWNFTKSKDYDGAWFVYCEVITETNHRYAFAAGAKFGIRDQLASVTMRTRRFNHLNAPRGLSHRDYDYTDDNGNVAKVDVFSIA